MRSRFPHGGEVLGAAPANPILAPVLSQDRGLSMSRQRDLLDLQAIQRIPGLVGYWKADPQYLFEDSAGTIPASTSGTGPVGSWYGVNAPTYGPNLVSNGAFDTDTTGWTAYTGSIAQENGELKLINGASAPYAYTYTPITTEVGGTYVVTATCHSESVNNMVSIFAGITTNGTTLGSDPGNYTVSGQALETLSFAFIASGTTTYIGAGNRGLANAIGYLDNITVKKVLSGAKAIQATTANKPILRKTPTTGIYWADSNTSTSALNVALSDTVLGRRNLFSYTFQLTNAYWSSGNVTTTYSGSIVSPDGVNNAALVTSNSAATLHLLGPLSGISLPSGVYSESWIIKKGTHNYIRIGMNIGASNYSTITIDLSSNTITDIRNSGSFSGASGVVSDYGGGWYHYTLTCTVPAGTVGASISFASSGTSAPTSYGVENYTTLGTETVYIWSAQLEPGSVATDYQKITNVPAYCTLARATAEGVTFTDNAEISPTYNIAPAFSFNSDVAIFNRALTATEKALITRYMQRAVPMLGSNLITNGTFESTASWTPASNTLFTSESGWGRVANNGSASRYISQAGVVIGTVYLAKVTARGDGSASPRMALGTTGGALTTGSSSIASQMLQLVGAPATTAAAFLYCNSATTSGVYTEFDNLTIQALL